MDVFKNKNKWLVSPVTFPGTWSWIWSWKTYKRIASTIYLNSKLEKIKFQYTHNLGQQKLAESSSIVRNSRNTLWDKKFHYPKIDKKESY